MVWERGMVRAVVLSGGDGEDRVGCFVGFLVALLAFLLLLVDFVGGGFSERV